MITPRHRFGREELSVSFPMRTHVEADPADVEGLAGELQLRLPHDVYSVALPSVEPGTTITTAGVVVTVRELARDRFSLSVEGEAERVVGVQTFNSEDRELYIDGSVVERTPGGSLMNVRVHGRPVRINVQVAREINRFSYPFRLQMERALPAAAEESAD
jgi:riboflavin synthase alpha subunit